VEGGRCVRVRVRVSDVVTSMTPGRHWVDSLIPSILKEWCLVNSPEPLDKCRKKD